MKKIYLYFFALLFVVSSCNKDSETSNVILENVEIIFRLQSGSFTCGEFCGTTFEIVGGERDLKSKCALPDSISSKWEYWNRQYMATVEFLEENCNCKLAVDPIPGSEEFPTLDLQVVQILSIREK